jgi:hypothetical protein
MSECTDWRVATVIFCKLAFGTVRNSESAFVLVTTKYGQCKVLERWFLDM